MQHGRVNLFASISILALGLLASATALAQAYPAKPIRLVVVIRLNAAIVKIMGTAEAREWFAELGGEPTTDRPEDFAAYVKSEHARLGRLIREAGIKAD